MATSLSENKLILGDRNYTGGMFNTITSVSDTSSIGSIYGVQTTEEYTHDSVTVEFPSGKWVGMYCKNVSLLTPGGVPSANSIQYSYDTGNSFTIRQKNGTREYEYFIGGGGIFIRIS